MNYHYLIVRRCTTVFVFASLMGIIPDLGRQAVRIAIINFVFKVK